MRRAFSMLELILALILFGIIVLALPPLYIILSSQSQEVLKNEATDQAFHTITTIFSYPWDEKSKSQETNFSLILDTQGDSELARFDHSRFRRASFGQKASRKFFANETSASIVLGKEGDLYNDIDDFNGAQEQITKAKGDILLEMNLTTHVQYLSDNANYGFSSLFFAPSLSSAPLSTNIKLIETQVRSSGDTIVVLRAFSCNVGEPHILSKAL